MRTMRAMSRSIMVPDISDELLSSRRERRVLLLAIREEMESIAEIADVEKSGWIVMDIAAPYEY